MRFFPLRFLMIMFNNVNVSMNLLHRIGDQKEIQVLLFCTFNVVGKRQDFFTLCQYPGPNIPLNIMVIECLKTNEQTNKTLTTS